MRNKSTLRFFQRYCLPWLVFVCGIIYYCYAYLLRVYTGLLEPNLIQTLSITSTGFGVLTSFYYFSYAPMQIPVGVAVDKIGPRRALLFSCTVAVFGAAIFAEAHQLGWALLGRFLIGFGSAFAYVTALKIATIWLPQRFFATAAGAVTATGMVAAIFTDTGLTHLLSVSSYFSVLALPIFVGIGLLFLILCLVYDKPKQPIIFLQQQEASAVSFRQLGQYLLLIFKSRQMWLIGSVGAFLYMPSSVFLDVWAIPYLETAYHLTLQSAAYAVSLMFLGWIISSFITGALSDFIGNRRIFLIMGCGLAAVLSYWVIYIPQSKSTLLWLMFLFGFSCGPHPLCFTLAKENCNVAVSGTAIAFANFVIMMGGFLFQPVVGKVLDIRRHGLMLHGKPLYTTANFHFALVVIPVALFLAFILSFFIKDTYKASFKED